jgi:hypothetical protein
MAASAYTVTPHQASLRISTTSEDATNDVREVDLERQPDLIGPMFGCGQKKR